jgi:hypothetical protein
MRPRARIIALIGDELISDEPVAVVELVKNAYDADATHVRVAFEGANDLDPETLIVEDDGHGMDLDTVLTGWFEPGTVHKKQGQRSPSGRLFQGAKGIGRFAAARLAESLLMETKTKGARTGVSVLLDWGSFTDSSYLDEVTIDYQIDPLSMLAHGTKLSLINLHARRHWSEDDFDALHNRLSRLVSPFQTSTGQAEVSDFEIELDIPGYPLLTGRVEPHKLTTVPKYRLAGELSEDGGFSGELVIDGEIVRRLKEYALGSKDEKVGCGPFAVEIRAWDRDRPGLTPYMVQFNESVTGLRRILNAYTGVSIYRDGFRVHPYGEQGLDWLSLDTRSRQNPTMRLANNQVIAAIRISRDGNVELSDRTNREGLVHNSAYDALIEWFTRILAILEEQRYRVRPREDNKPEETSTLFEPFDMSDVVKRTDEQLGATHPVTQLVKTKDSEIRDGVKRLQDHYSRVLMAAGLGQLIDLVVHEIGAPLGRAHRELKNLETALHATLGDHRFAGLKDNFKNLRAYLEQIYALRERLIPKVAGKRGRATSFAVQEEIQGNLELYSNLIAKQRIAVETKFPKDSLVVHMSRSNLGQIIANLLDNSIYWLTQHHGDGKGGRIGIRLTSLRSGFRVRIADDGPGVEEGDRDRIFDAEFTRKSNGIGLGLFIARQVIESYGKLLYRDDGPFPGACFEATFERSVGL